MITHPFNTRLMHILSFTLSTFVSPILLSTPSHPHFQPSSRTSTHPAPYPPPLPPILPPLLQDFQDVEEVAYESKQLAYTLSHPLTHSQTPSRTLSHIPSFAYPYPPLIMPPSPLTPKRTSRM